MMKHDEILAEWSKDCFIDESNLKQEILRIPQLHAKYLKELNDNKNAAKVNEFKYYKLKNIKIEYYSGNLDKETLDEYGWEQFDLRIGTKGNIDRYISADEDLIELLKKKYYHEESVEVCKQILDQLKSRTFQLKSFIEYEKFQAGY